MTFDHLIVAAKLSPFILVIGYLLMVAFNATGIPFRFKLRVLQRVAEANGLVQSGKLFEKEVSGCLLVLSLKRVRSGKSHVDQFRASLHLPRFAGDYSLRTEGLMSGMSRVGGRKEESLDDEDFDHAFWVETDQPKELREFLTVARRQALIYACGEDGQVQNNVATIERNYFHPFYGRGQFCRALTRLQTLAEVFTGVAEAPPEVLNAARSVSARKTRKFVPWAAFWSFGAPFFLSALLGNTVTMRGSGEFVNLTHGAGVLSCIGLAISGIALTGSQAARVVLQSFFAFLSVLSGLGPLVALLLIEVPGGFESKATVLVGGFVLGLVTWSVRHYLKSLERPIKAVVVEDSPAL